MSEIEITVPTANPTVEIVAGGATTLADIIGSSELGRSLLSAASVAAAIALLGGSVATLDEYLTGGAGTPGGADTQVQFNDAGAFGGSSGLTFNKTTGKLVVGTDASEMGDYFYSSVSAKVSSVTKGSVTSNYEGRVALRGEAIHTGNGAGANGTSTGVLGVSIVSDAATANAYWSVAGVFHAMNRAPSPYNVNYVTGLYGYADHIGTGTASIVEGLNFSAQSYSYGFGAPGNIGEARVAVLGSYFEGNVGTFYSIYAARPYIVTGKTITTAYGLYVGNHTVPGTGGTVTNGWNIYSAGSTSRNYFEGKVGIGITAPTEALDVTGNVNVLGRQINTYSGAFDAINITSTHNPASAAFRSGIKASVTTHTDRNGYNATTNGVAGIVYVPNTLTSTWWSVKAGEFDVYSDANQSVTALTAMSGVLEHTGTGNVSSARAMLFDIYTYKAGASLGSIGSMSGIEITLGHDAAGSGTNMTGLDISHYNAGTVTNAYGVKINNFSSGGTITNGWNIYSDGATSRNYFAGKVGIGVTAPSVALDVLGKVQFGPALFDQYSEFADNRLSVRLDSATPTGNFSDSVAARFQAFAPDATGGFNYHTTAGVQSYVFNPTTRQVGGNPTIYAADLQAINRSTFPAYDVEGVFGYAIHAGTGTLEYLNGLQFGVYAIDWFGESITIGNVTNASGVQIVPWFETNVTTFKAVVAYRPEVGTGKAITNAYGVWIGDHTVPVGSGTITNGWNIYSEGSTSRNYFAGKVGIGVAAPTVALDVLGDTLQTGNVSQVLTATSPSAAYGHNIAYTITQNAATGQYRAAFRAVTVVNGSGAGVYPIGGIFVASYAGSAAAGDVEGLYGEAFVSSGSATNVAALDFSSYIEGGTATNIYGIRLNAGSMYGGSATNAYGVRLIKSYIGSGLTITNNYGFYVDDCSTSTGPGTITNGWNIYSGGATSRNYFAGKVGIGIAAPVAAPLEIVGNAAGVIHMTASQNVAYWKALTIYNSGMGSGNGAQIVIGQAASVNNAFEFAFFYTSSGSSSNYGAFGLYNTPDTFKIFDNRVEINKTLTLASAMLQMAAATTARASLNMPAGVAPTSPTNGDMWFDGTDIKMRVGGVTKTFTLV
jgi:hypothetical protein